MLPYYPIKDNGAFHWEIYSYSNKMIADYCNIPVNKVKALPLDEWLMYRRDSFIFNCRADRKRTKISEKRLFDDADKAGYKKIEGSVWVKFIVEMYML